MINFKPLILIFLINVFLIMSCDNLGMSARETPDEVAFIPSYNGESIGCDSVITHSDDRWHYTQLQFYISDISLKDSMGKWQKAPLVPSPYQTSNVALLGENCNLGKENSKANWSVILTKQARLINSSQIRFTLGLPFAVNHLNPLTQQSPLNVPTMFWGWQQGHKFLRLEMSSSKHDWLFHLGSVACQSASPLRAPIKECRYPNRYTFELPLSKANPVVIFELSALLNNIMISEQNHCQSSPNKPSCQILVTNLQQQGALAVFQNNQQTRPHE